MTQPDVFHISQRALRNMLGRKGSDFTIDSALEYHPPLAPLYNKTGAIPAEEIGAETITNMFRLEKQRGEQNKQIKAMLFDWDLTLADGEVLNLAALNHTFDVMERKGHQVTGLKNWDKPRMRQEFAGTVPTFFQKAYGQLGEEAVQEAMAVFREYRSAHRELVALQPHAKETLRSLLKAGIKVGIVSNKDEDELLALKAVLFAEPEFRNIAVVGAKVGMVSKPSPEPIYEAFTQLGIRQIDAPSVMMVGDQIQSDIASALAANCQPCLVGQNDLEPLHAMASHVLQTPENGGATIVRNFDGKKIIHTENLETLLHHVELERSNNVSARAH